MPNKIEKESLNLTLKQAFEKATVGPLKATQARVGVAGEENVLYHIFDVSRSLPIAAMNNMSLEEECVTASLLVHCHKHFDEAVKIIKELSDALAKSDADYFEDKGGPYVQRDIVTKARDFASNANKVVV